MTEAAVRIEASVAAARRYLESYCLCEKFLAAGRYEREYFGEKAHADEVFWQAERYDVRSFVGGLPPCREKLFLHCRYIRGHSMEKCAELMEVSVRSAYRIQKRALALAAAHLEETKKRQFFPSSGIQ